MVGQPLELRARFAAAHAVAYVSDANTIIRALTPNPRLLVSAVRRHGLAYYTDRLRIRRALAAQTLHRRRSRPPLPVAGVAAAAGLCLKANVRC